MLNYYPELFFIRHKFGVSDMYRIFKEDKQIVLCFSCEDLSNLTTPRTEDSLHFSEDMLLTKEELPLQSNVYSLSQLNEIYERSANLKIEFMDMGPYGKGPIAKQEIPKDTLFIYMGHYSHDNNHPISGREYLIETCSTKEKPLIIDGERINSVSRYLQHLPNTHAVPEVATANLVGVGGFLRFNQGYLPVTFLQTNRNILVNELLGFDYTDSAKSIHNYWAQREISPALFTKDGRVHRQTFSFNLTIVDESPLLFANMTRDFLLDSSILPAGFHYVQSQDTFYLIYFPPTEAASILEWVLKELPRAAATPGTYLLNQYVIPLAVLPGIIISIASDSNRTFIQMSKNQNAHSEEMLNEFANSGLLTKYQHTWLLDIEEFKSFSMKKVIKLDERTYGFMTSQTLNRRRHPFLRLLINDDATTNSFFIKELFKHYDLNNFQEFLLITAMGGHAKSVDIFNYILTNFDSVIDINSKSSLYNKSISEILNETHKIDKVNARRQAMLSILNAFQNKVHVNADCDSNPAAAASF